MRRSPQRIDKDNTFYEPSRDSQQGTLILVVIMTILFVVLTSVLAIIYFGKNTAGTSGEPIEMSYTNNDGFLVVATSTPTPVQPMALHENPVLYPATANCNAEISVVTEGSRAPSSRAVTQQILHNYDIISEYSRTNAIHFGDPIEYSDVQGILTYRGNNFRNCASFGNTTVTEGTLSQVWEFSGIGTRLSSTMTFEWSGVAWTGQPLVICWPAETRAIMNLYPEKAQKADLVEVIVAGLDGYVYFFDLDDGSQTRDPLNVGSSIKGTPALDPRGYPILYVGQGDDNGSDGFGMRIFSLIDGSQLYFYDGLDDRAYRENWGAFDSSPIIDAMTDTLIWPCENGIIYTFNLNTVYTPGTGHVTMTPEMVGYKYIFADSSAARLGFESSIAMYGGYGYLCDNSGNLICVDLNSMEMIWQIQLGDESDLTPAIEEENGVPFIYVGTEVDNQGGSGEYCGAAYVYKINGITGDVVWQNSFPCYTYNGETSETDQNGGCFGNPIIGKHGVSNLVIFSFSMSNGLASGNRLVAYNKATGTQEWVYEMNIYSYSSPVDCYDEAGNCYIVIGDSVGQIHLVNAATGERITYIQTARNIGTSSETISGIVFEASPVVYNNTIIIGTKSGSVFAIRIA